MRVKQGLIMGMVSALMLIAGCTPAIPEGKIKDFVENIEFEKTFNNVHIGESVIHAKHFEDGVEVGSIIITTYIDKTSDYNYYYQKTEVSGNYHGTEEDQYPFFKEEMLFYLEKEDIIVGQKKTDGAYNEIVGFYDNIKTYTDEFFYLKLDSGYHSGGVYYGDYVLANCGKYYNEFSLNEEKEILTYEINVKSNDIDNNEIITMHKFSVDKFGMLLDLSSTTFYVENPGNKVETTIHCDYSGNFTKVYSL